MIDRFNDGDPTNNDLGANEFDRKNEAKFHGGDLKGIIERILYIKKLGATAVWITPPVANQWWDPWTNYGGYHGYWAESLVEIDKHFGDLKTYKKLANELHNNGLLLIQDIVCNHMGNFFRFVNNKYERNLKSVPVTAPTQYPFNMNDPTNKSDKIADVYHWTPDILDYHDDYQIKNYQLGGLDDLNTSNQIVRDALKDSYNYWIKEVGVDGFRIDTIMYLEHEFLNDFLHSTDKNHPGILNYAQSQGKDFFDFGETWIIPPPYMPDGDIKASSYLGTKEKPELTSVINFPLNSSIQLVFKDERPTSILTYSLNNLYKYYNNPNMMINFIDNHDMDRFLANGNINSVKQAIAFILTIPGIPVIYYGTEQKFTKNREYMGSNYKPEGEFFEFMQRLIKIRKDNQILRRGVLKVIQDNNKDSGLFAYSMNYKGKKMYVFFNTSEFPQFVEKAKTELEPFTKLEPVFSIHEQKEDLLQIDKDATFSSLLHPRDILILRSTGIIQTAKKRKNVYDELRAEFKKLSNEYGISGSDSTLNKVGEYIDKIGDDKGRQGCYKYPTDSSFKGQMDMEKVIVYTSGKNLVISVKMANGISDVWNPRYGFDHVRFNIFIDMPKKNGVKYMPMQNCKLPSEMHWDYLVTCGGWTNGVCNTNGSSENNYGEFIGPTPKIYVDKEKGNVDFFIYGLSLGNPDSFSGTKIYVNTWDYDGMNGLFRPLEKEPKPFAFGGGASKDDPLIMDETEIITIK